MGCLDSNDRAPHPSVGMRFRLAALALCTGLAPSLVHGQGVTGPARCTGCHDHARQTQKRRWTSRPARRPRTRERARPPRRPQGGGLHASSASRGLELGRRLRSLSCHRLRRAQRGVSCESCHGPASGWIELHQTRRSYAQAVASGMGSARQAAGDRRKVRDLPLHDRRAPRGGGPSSGASLTRAAASRGSSTGRHATTRRKTAAARRSPRRVSAAVRRPAARPRDGRQSTRDRRHRAPLPPVASAPGSAWQDVQPLPSDYAAEPSAPPSPRDRVIRARPAPAGCHDLGSRGCCACRSRRRRVPVRCRRALRARLLRPRGRGLLLLAEMLGTAAGPRASAASGPARILGPESELCVCRTRSSRCCGRSSANRAVSGPVLGSCARRTRRACACSCLPTRPSSRGCR
jgi:hypothetical protein